MPFFFIAFVAGCALQGDPSPPSQARTPEEEQPSPAIQHSLKKTKPQSLRKVLTRVLGGQEGEPSAPPAAEPPPITQDPDVDGALDPVDTGDTGQPAE